MMGLMMVSMIVTIQNHRVDDLRGTLMMVPIFKKFEKLTMHLELTKKLLKTTIRQGLNRSNNDTNTSLTYGVDGLDRNAN